MKPNRLGPVVFATTALSFVLVSAGLQPAAAADNVYLSGVVRDAQGPVVGASVSARAEGSNITTSVYTDTKGTYYFPAMAGGQYRIWAQNQGYNTTKDDSTLNGVAHENFTLSPVADIGMQMTGGDFLASLPQATPEDKRLQRVVYTSCTGCHPPNYPMQHKFDETGWNAIINQMKRFIRGGNGKVFQTIDMHQKELAAYLARARGPGESSMKITLQPRQTGDQARIVYRTYAVVTDPGENFPTRYVTQDGHDWSLGTPSKGGGAAGIHDVIADLDGNAWFTYNSPSRIITVGRVDAKTGKVKFFRVDGANGLAAGSHGLARSADGNLWFNVMMGGKVAWLARIDPKVQEIKVFQTPEGVPPIGGTVAVDSKGDIWASDETQDKMGGAVRFDPKTEKFSVYKSLTKAMTYGVAGDRDGNGWWTQILGDTVDKVDVKTGKVTEIKLDPVPGYKELWTPAEMAVYNANPNLNTSVGLPWAQGPRRNDADPNADVVWVCNWWGGNLARIDTHTLKVTYVPLPDPTSMQAYSAKVDSHHNVWVVTQNTDQVLKYDPSAKKWTAYDIPVRGAENRQLALLERDGKLQVFVPHSRTREVGIMSFRSEADLQALESVGTKQKQALNR